MTRIDTLRVCLFAKPDSPHTRRIVAGLVEHGVAVHIVYDQPGQVPGATFEPFNVPKPSWRHPRRWVPRKLAYLGTFLQNFDVVGVHFLHPWGFWPEVIDKGCFTVTPWGSDITPPPAGPRPSERTTKMRRIMLRCADGICACGQPFCDEIAEFAGIDRQRIDVVALGVDTNLFRPLPPVTDRPVVGFFKGFGYAYGADHLIRAMPQIIAAVPDVSFEMIGQGPLLPQCRALAANLDVTDRIRWRKPVDHDKLPTTIGRWQVSVIPSEAESFGVAALESSAMQVPVVASNVGGLPGNVIDNRTGLLVPPGDSAAIAQAVIDLLRDPDRRTDLGAAGRRYVQEHFEWRDCVRQWVSFYENAAARVATGVA